MEIIIVSISWRKHNIPGTLTSMERGTDQGGVERTYFLVENVIFVFFGNMRKYGHCKYNKIVVVDTGRGANIFVALSIQLWEIPVSNFPPSSHQKVIL